MERHTPAIEGTANHSAARNGGAPGLPLCQDKETLKMRGRLDSVEVMVREGFNLLLELRRHPEARRLMPLANAFLQTLLHQADRDVPPFVVSVKAMPIRKH